jgi:hypothetical protein
VGNSHASGNGHVREHQVRSKRQYTPPERVLPRGEFEIEDIAYRKPGTYPPKAVREMVLILARLTRLTGPQQHRLLSFSS